MQFSTIILATLAAVVAASPKDKEATPPTLCFASTFSPSTSDCLKAIASINVKNDICAAIFSPTWTYATYGTCKIEGYSGEGSANCFDLKKVVDTAKRLVKECGEGGARGQIAGITSLFPGRQVGIRIMDGTSESVQPF